MSPRLALRQRPEAAFESLYKRHVREVYAYAYAVLGSPADAEDVTQTTFLNAYRAFQGGERPRKARSWLFAIAHNVCRQRFRQAARRPREVVLDEQLAGVAEPDAPSAEDIARALQSLPFNQRSALVLRELEGRRQTEIAEALGVSVSAVETLLFRARRGVREQLENSLTCGEAARAISRQLDGDSSRDERAALRAHLRDCAECATFARRARAQRGALRRLPALPLPASLLTWSGALGGAGTATVAAPATGLGIKLLAGTAVLAAAAGAGDQRVDRPDPPPRAAATAPAPARTPLAGAAAAQPVETLVPVDRIAGPATGTAAVEARRDGSRRAKAKPAKPAARRGTKVKHARPATPHRTKAKRAKPAAPARAKRGGHGKPATLERGTRTKPPKSGKDKPGQGLSRPSARDGSHPSRPR